MCTKCVPAVSQDEVAEELLRMVSGGTIALMLSIGYRTGLLETMSGLAPSTSQDIADAAGLNERYVREWLNAMVTSNIVGYDRDSTAYQIRPEYAAMLTDAGEANMASMMQFMSVLGNVEDRLVECFRDGGGVRYEEYGRFHEVMAAESMQTTVKALEDYILPVIPEMIPRLEEGIEVLDVGCGRGLAIMELARMFPNSRFTGYDFSGEANAFARAEAVRRGLTNVRFELQDAAKFEDENRFDLITAFDAIHDQADPDAVLRNISRALADNGVFLMQDIRMHTDVADNMENPLAPFVYSISCMHCMTVSLALGGKGLGAAWGQELALQMLSEAGFGNVDLRTLGHDVQNNYYIARKR